MNIRYIFITILLIISLSHVKGQIDTLSFEETMNMPIEKLLNVKAITPSKYKQKTGKAPANILIISSEMIKEKGYRDLTEVLKNCAGIDLVDHARGFGQYFIIRGIEGNDRFLIMIDGQKINPASGTFLSIGHSIPIDFIKQIEIVFGPASALYGADAFSGIINIITYNECKSTSIRGFLGYGSFNSADASIDSRFRIAKDISLFFNIRAYYSDGIDFTGRDTVYQIIQKYQYPQVNKFEQPIDDYSIFSKFIYKNFSISYFNQTFDEGNALGTHPRGNIFNSEYKWAFTTQMVNANYENEIIAKGRIFIEAAYINHTQSPETQFYKWKKSYTVTDAFSQYMTGIDHTFRTTISFNKEVNSKFSFITGLEYENTNSIPPYANDEILGNSFKFEGENEKKIKNELEITEQRFAWFGQITYSPFSKIDIILGGRFDNSSNNGDIFNPRLGLIFSPLKSTTFKFLYGTAFQAPSLFYKYEQWGAATTVMLSTAEVNKIDPSWKLKNQKIETFDINISQLIGRTALINVSIYQHFLKDLIERVVFTSHAYNKYYSLNGNQVYSNGIRNENIGKQHISGFDITCNYHINSLLSGNVMYSYVRAKSQTDNQADIARISTNKFWAGITFQNILNFLNITANFKWYSDINNRNLTIFPSGKQPGYKILDLAFITKKIHNKWRFSLKLNNVFDTNIEHGGLYEQTGGYMPTIPQPKFNLFGGIEVSF